MVKEIVNSNLNVCDIKTLFKFLKSKDKINFDNDVILIEVTVRETVVAVSFKSQKYKLKL